MRTVLASSSRSSATVVLRPTDDGICQYWRSSRVLPSSVPAPAAMVRMLAAGSR